MSDRINEFEKDYSKHVETNKKRKYYIKNNQVNQELPSTDFTINKNLVIIVNNSEIEINEKSTKKQNFSSNVISGISSSKTSKNFEQANFAEKKGIKTVSKGINYLGKKIKDLTDEQKFNKNQNIFPKEMKNNTYFDKVNVENENGDGKKIKSMNLNKNDNNSLGNVPNEGRYFYKININETELLHQTIEYKNRPFYNDPFDIINNNNKIKDLFLIK